MSAHQRARAFPTRTSCSGVRNVEVSLEEGKATLEAGMVASNAKLIAAVEGAGFKATVSDPANHAGGGAF